MKHITFLAVLFIVFFGHSQSQKTKFKITYYPCFILESDIRFPPRTVVDIDSNTWVLNVDLKKAVVSCIVYKGKSKKIYYKWESTILWNPVPNTDTNFYRLFVNSPNGFQQLIIPNDFSFVEGTNKTKEMLISDDKELLSSFIPPSFFYKHKNGQEINSVLKSNLVEAISNGFDVSKQIIDAGGQLVFYTIPQDNTLYFANIQTKKDSQSYGSIFGINYMEDANTVVFSWEYKNTFDPNTGVATVILEKKEDHISVQISYKGGVLNYKGTIDDFDLGVFKKYIK